MAWEEWEQSKAAAAGRHTAPAPLHELPAHQGGGAPHLLSNRSAWTRAGGDIDALRTDISKATAKLKDGQTGLGSPSGCLTATAQKDIHVSWETYLTEVGGRCGKLSGLLVKAGNDQSETEQSITARITTLDAMYADTPAVGGRTTGR
ncbi:hypothetical protein [Streptomyces griseoflavus]|uniref:hypothetical protein n=1 Tax=Streptomyces griseoflavus TaxID=35619 RepID=UPI0033ED9FEA